MNRLAVLAFVLAAGTAHADDTANALFEEAQAKYAAGEYRVAIELFEQAYSLARDPVYLFNIAQSYRKLFDCVQATNHYERFLVEATDLDKPQRDQITKWIRELAPCVEERRREAAKAREQEVPQPLGILVEPTYREVHHGRIHRISGIALGGVGVAVLGLAAYYSKRGSDIRDELAGACAMPCDWTPALEAKERDGQRANTISLVGYLGGGAALVGGTVLYFVGRSKPIERIQVTPVSGGATVSARFMW